MSHEDKYYICSRIDAQQRYFGLTLDELLPILIVIGFGAFFINLITGFALGAVVWYAVRYFKKGQGTSWFLNMLYWYLPLHVLGVLFQRTPASSLRHWLS